MSTASVGSAKFPSLNFFLKGAISVRSVWLLSEQFLEISKRVPQAVFGHTLMTVFIAVCTVCHPRNHRRHSLFFRRAGICNWEMALPSGILCPHLFVWLPVAEVAGRHHCGLSVLRSQCRSLGSAWQTWALPNPWHGFPELSWAELGLSWSGTAWPGTLSIWDLLCTKSAHQMDFRRV